MSKYKTADEIRARANERLKKELEKANAIERKENERIGKELKVLARELDKTPDDLIRWAKEQLSTVSPQAEASSGNE